MGNSFSRFGEFSAIILLNILHVPFACTYSPSSMPMILRFGLLTESMNSCIFLSQLLSLLSKNSSVFFFKVYFIFKPLDSVFHLFYSARVPFHCIF
jgi:hypothetical protein